MSHARTIQYMCSNPLFKCLLNQCFYPLKQYKEGSVYCLYTSLSLFVEAWLTIIIDQDYVTKISLGNKII